MKSEADISKAQFKRYLTNFTPVEETSTFSEGTKASSDMQEQLNSERLRELRSKYYGRIGFSIYFALLLACQNIIVFFIVYRAFEAHALKDLQLIFATLIGATLTETYLITRVIVNFMFKENDYTIPKQ